MRIATVVFAFLLACSDDETVAMDAAIDAARDASVDATPDAIGDATPLDAMADAVPRDAGADGDASPDGGSSAIRVTGTCGTLDDELTSTAPASFSNAIVVSMGGIVATNLSAGAQRILAEPNAGGSSRYSEAVAYEVLEQCEGATLHATETEVEYMTMMPPSRTDLVVDFAATRIGVGVTRSFAFGGVCMPSPSLAAAAATEQLRDKLADIVDSTGAVADADRWVKQILFILVRSLEDAATVVAAWNGLDTERGDTVLYVVSSSGSDNQIFFEDRCPP
ncbi:MAG: hypothetical protein AAGF12_30315 [Myxococcota bacterium]